MARRRVLILENEFLLNAGVRSLLSKQENLEVLTAKFTSHTEIFHIIDAFRPDVLVMDEEGLIEGGGALVTSLKGYPKLRTVVVLWEDNQVQIYDSEKVMIRGLDDFLAVI